MRAAHLHPSYELVDWKRVGQNKLVALVRSALVRVKFQDSSSQQGTESNGQDQNALSFDTTKSQQALQQAGDQSGTSSNSTQEDFASYILIFKAAPRATWVFERKIKLALPYVKQESQGSDDQGSNGKGSLYKTLQDLLVEQPVTPYTPNAGLVRVNGVAQDTVHFGSGQESSWNSQRSQKGLKNNPGPKAVTGFKLDKGRAYQKLNEAWPVYEPLDSTKEGKEKNESEWKSSGASEAKNDAPLVGSTGSQMAAVTDNQQSGDNNGLVSLAQRSTTVAVQKSDSSGSQGQGTTDNKFQKYLNTTQALHQMGVIVPSLETWPGKPSTGIATRAAGGVSVQAATRQSTSTNEDLSNVITQLYHTSTSQLAYLNGQIVVMGSDRVPSLWYWVVDERTTSGRATWWAHTELNWGTDKQKQFVENQLGFKDDSNSDSKNSNLKAQGLTQPAYLIAGLDVVADHLVFAAFKAGAVGYDMTTDSNASTKDQVLAWSTTAGLDSDGGYKALVENTAGLNGSINGLFILLDTFAYVTPVSGMKGGSKNTEAVQTKYPVKDDSKASAKIASLINASPLNSYGDDGVTVFDALGLNFNFKLDEARLPSRTDQLLVYGIVNESELKSARENAQSTSDDNSNTKVKWTNTASHYLPVPYYYSANFPEAGNRRRAEQRNGVITIKKAIYPEVRGRQLQNIFDDWKTNKSR